MPSSTSRSRRLLRFLLLALGVAALATAPAALAAGRIDRSFGEDGTVDIGAHLANGSYLGVVGVAPDGPIYFTEQRPDSCRHGCRYEERLRRFDADGDFDAGYSAPAATRRGVAEGSTSIAVDSRGRVILSWEAGGHGFIRRLLPDGSLDESFAKGGTYELPCHCSLSEVELTADGGMAFSASREAGTFKHYVGIAFAFELNADGKPVRRFGGDGVVRLRLPGKAAGTVLPAGGGSLLLDGSFCCGEAAPQYGWVTRLTLRGRPQPRFAANAAASFRGLFGKRELLWEYSYLLPRRGGSLLFGSGFGPVDVVALRNDGRLDRSFGHGGLAEVKMGSADAAVDAAGRIWIVGAHGHFEVQRLTARGRPDTSFGTVSLGGLGSEYGLYLFPDGEGRAIVVSPDESVCRGECPSDPKMVRVVG